MQKKKPLNRVYRTNKNIVARNIGNKILMIPICKEAIDSDSIFKIEENSGIEIWNLINGKNNVESIIEKISKIYPNVDEKRIKNSVMEFLNDLEKNKLIELNK